MPTRELLSPVQRPQFTELPEPLEERALVRYCTLSPEDLAYVEGKRGDHNRLGFAVQLCLLRFLGRPLGPSEQAPEAMLQYIAAQIHVDPGAFRAYGERENTRREHLAELARVYGYSSFDEDAQRQLAGWLLPAALGTDSGTAIVAALIDEMRRRKVILPALSTVERLGWEVRHRARSLVFEQLAGGLAQHQRDALDGLLSVDEPSHQTVLAWLRQPPGAPSPANVLKLIEKLDFIRALALPPETGRWCIRTGCCNWRGRAPRPNPNIWLDLTLSAAMQHWLPSSRKLWRPSRMTRSRCTTGS